MEHRVKKESKKITNPLAPVIRKRLPQLLKKVNKQKPIFFKIGILRK